MAEKGKAAVYHGLGKPMVTQEFPVPEPEPGAIVVKLTRANVCGSDLHMWRGDLDLGALGAPLPVILGHEMTGSVARLGQGIFMDSAGEPLQEGDRVVYRYFYPCGHCKICLSGDDGCCPMNNFFMLTCADPPHFNGAYGEYYYLRPNHTVFKVPDELTDDMVAPINCALSEVIYGLEKVGLRFGETIVIQGAGGLGLYATAVAKEMGASKVIVVDGIDDRLELAKAFGADEVVDMKKHETPVERMTAVMGLTGGSGRGGGTGGLCDRHSRGSGHARERGAVARDRQHLSGPHLHLRPGLPRHVLQEHRFRGLLQRPDPEEGPGFHAPHKGQVPLRENPLQELSPGGNREGL